MTANTIMSKQDADVGKQRTEIVASQPAIRFNNKKLQNENMAPNMSEGTNPADAEPTP